jgi:hypothetical protein
MHGTGVVTVSGKRFYYVASRRARAMHRADSITEGNRTWCGVLIRIGWKWRRDKRGQKVCKRCEAAR